MFLSAFIIRKLMNSGRLSVQVEDSEVFVRRFPARAAQGSPDLMNWEQLDRFYDVTNGLEVAVRLRHVTNWIVHSFVFLAEVESDHAGSDRLSAFWCNSDRTRGSEVIRVAWPDYRRAVQLVVDDNVVSAIMLRDGQGSYRQLLSDAPITPEQEDAFRQRHASFIDEVARSRPAT